MGVLNVTPDSFSDGGSWSERAVAVDHGLELLAQGADIVDVGGESTRPGATPVDPAEERERVVPVIRALADAGATVSVDTRNADTARAAVDAGARLVNDVSGGTHDRGMARAVAETGVRYVAMHWGGGAEATPRYADVVAEVRDALRERIADLIAAGVDPGRIVVDPGLGFGKAADDNWRLLGHLPELAALGHDVLVGASRKRFVGALLPDGSTMGDRDLPTAIVSALAARAGAWAVRVHDVPSTRLALQVQDSWQEGATR
jgi:dihydropteroate synthase